MTIDMHVHLLGDCIDIEKALNHEAIYYNPDDNNKDLSSFFIKNIVIQEIKGYIGEFMDHKITGKGIPESDYINMIYKLFTSSKELDCIVLLAMDGCYHHRLKTLQVRQTDLLISNKFLWNKVNELNSRLDRDGYSNKRFLFGASVNPNREDWEEELNYVINDTEAVLLKLIPSVHDVDLDDEQYIPFYKKLAESNLPLLCHTGPELAFAEGLNNPEKDKYTFLDYPLSHGVKVIAAHCAAPFFPGEEKSVIEFAEYMKKWNFGDEIKLWADTSALMTSFRTGYIRRFVKGYNPNWLIHGSDTPVPLKATDHLPYFTYDVSFDEFFDFINDRNLFDKEIKIKRAHGMKNSILSNAKNVLRMPKNLHIP